MFFKRIIYYFLICIICLTISPDFEPIDIVYTWVDGSDPEWLAIKDSFLSSLVKKAFSSGSGSDYEDTSSRRAFLHKMATIFDSATDNRFINNHELRYSLRSVYAYAPFVNHIYIITMGQRPEWLAEHPKITIIDHKQIFKDLNDLPTFNSHAIESNLHRIPGLSERFIYFNDDVFLGAPVYPQDFFVADAINVLFEQGLSPSGQPIEGETAYRKAWRNTNRFLDAHFYAEPRHRLCHMPFALRKSYMQEFEARHPEIFATNSSHKFRSDHDYNVVNGLLHHYWLYQDRIISKPFASRPVSTFMVTFRPDAVLARTIKQLKKMEKNWPVTFCLQDLMDEDSIQAKKLLHEFLERHYPQPAPWEKLQ